MKLTFKQKVKEKYLTCTQELAGDFLKLPQVDKTKKYNEKTKTIDKAVKQVLVIRRGSLVV